MHGAGAAPASASRDPLAPELKPIDRAARVQQLSDAETRPLLRRYVGGRRHLPAQPHPELAGRDSAARCRHRDRAAELSHHPARPAERGLPRAAPRHGCARVRALEHCHASHAAPEPGSGKRQKARCQRHRDRRLSVAPLIAATWLLTTALSAVQTETFDAGAIARFALLWWSSCRSRAGYCTSQCGDTATRGAGHGANSLR